MRLEDVEIKLPDEGRAGFRFVYESEKLKEACQLRSLYHRNRQDFYIEQAATLEAKLREKGVELREQQMTGGPSFAAVVDAEISTELQKARQKRDWHRQEAELYEAYSGAFGSSTTTYWLTIDDVRYFGIYKEKDEA